VLLLGVYYLWRSDSALLNRFKSNSTPSILPDTKIVETASTVTPVLETAAATAVESATNAAATATATVAPGHAELLQKLKSIADE